MNLLKDTQLFWFSLLVTNEPSKNLFNLCKLHFLLSILQLALDQKWNFYKLQYFAFSGTMSFVVLIVFAFISRKISEKNNRWIAWTLGFSRKVSNSPCFSSVNTNKLVMLVLQATVFLISVSTVRWIYTSSRIPWAPVSVPTDSVYLIGRWKSSFQSCWYSLWRNDTYWKQLVTLLTDLMNSQRQEEPASVPCVLFMYQVPSLFLHWLTTNY